MNLDDIIPTGENKLQNFKNDTFICYTVAARVLVGYEIWLDLFNHLIGYSEYKSGLLKFAMNSR